MEYKLHAEYDPTGDQPQAIAELAGGVNDGVPYQTLLGVTGSGKTFTMANVIAQTGRPTLVLSHNKTLAAQLYAEFKSFFPENAVHYFVSYYDYYQPEAYIPSTDKYIEKDLAINDEIERLRLSTVTALLSGRRDIVVVSSVSCLYGMGNPEDITANAIQLRVGDQIGRDELLHRLSFFSSFSSKIVLYPLLFHLYSKEIHQYIQIQYLHHYHLHPHNCLPKYIFVFYYYCFFLLVLYFHHFQ